MSTTGDTTQPDDIGRIAALDERIAVARAGKPLVVRRAQEAGEALFDGPAPVSAPVRRGSPRSPPAGTGSPNSSSTTPSAAPTRCTATTCPPTPRCAPPPRTSTSSPSPPPSPLVRTWPG